MKAEDKTEYAKRDSIMKLLSDDEVAAVSTAETAARLGAGDEYVDLEMLSGGVRRATAQPPTPMGRVLPRKAVRADTWRQIVTLVSTP